MKAAYAGLLPRLGAFIIDGFLVSAVSVPIGVWVSLSTPWLRSGGYILLFPLITLGIASVFGLPYFTLFWWWRGQTPGKMAMRIKIVRTNGETLSLSRATLRYLGYLVSYLTLYFGFIMVAFDRQKRGLHDLIADTSVIKA